MIDLHIHILPGVDDGSQSMEESLYMAQMAAASGVHTIVATPHCNIPDEYDNYEGEAWVKKLEEFRKEVKRLQIDLEILRGMEVFGTERVPELLRDGRLVCLNEGNYLLVEFAFEENPLLVRQVLEGILQQDKIPVIAHPERYDFVARDPQLVYEWNCMGCGIQMNKGSILGRFGRQIRELSIELLRHQVVSCIASDAHGCSQRTPSLDSVWEVLERMFGEECPMILLEDNPGRILESEEIYRLMPRGFH